MRSYAFTLRESFCSCSMRREKLSKHRAYFSGKEQQRVRLLLSIGAFFAVLMRTQLFCLLSSESAARLNASFPRSV